MTVVKQQGFPAFGSKTRKDMDYVLVMCSNV